MKFSPRVAHRLTQAGWSEGRRIDSSPLVDYLSFEGFAFPCALVEEFLEEFGYLHVITPEPERVYLKNVILFSPEAEERFFQKFHFDPSIIGDDLFEIIEAGRTTE